MARALKEFMNAAWQVGWRVLVLSSPFLLLGLSL
jgi:hypothetical protein